MNWHSALAGLTLCGAMGAAAGQTPIGADEFAAFVTGRTLIFGTAAGPYGMEEYSEGRRVRWSFLDGDCVEGVWYPQDGAICFAYEGRPEPQCWHFYLQGGQLSANTVEQTGAPPLYVIRESDAPMQCLGPRIGV
ncbi:hypothetical protein [Meridianimarinicoccus roseus]|nr:hypothetical protein [Meridianimarinicoccus roseus]